jgi:septal ring factor EnvC (AmiA/AmiB activator)
MEQLCRQSWAKKVLACVIALIVLTVTIPIASPVKVKAASVSDLQNQLNQLQKDKSSLTSQLDKLGDSISDEEEKLEGYKEVMANIKEQLDLYQQQIDAVNLQIDEKNAAIEEKNKEIEKTNTEISEKEKTLEETDELFKERLAANYVNSSSSSTLSLLFGAQSFSDFLTRVEVIKNIAEKDSDLMDELTRQKAELQSLKDDLEATKKEIENEKAEIEKKKADIVTLKANVQTKSDEYNGLISESKSLISSLNAKQGSLQENIAALDQENAYIQQQIEQAQQQQQKPTNPDGGSSGNGGDNGSSGGGNSGSGGNGGGGASSAGYIWPVPNYSYVSTEFGASGNLWGGNNHNGMDIAAPGGSSIYACRGGTVVIAKDGCAVGDRWANGGYGNYVVIDHGDGYQTLYAHMRQGSVNVRAGQTVSQGQLIGLVGTTGNSTGNHCHLEVRKNGVRVNPRNYVTEPR